MKNKFSILLTIFVFTASFVFAQQQRDETYGHSEVMDDDDTDCADWVFGGIKDDGTFSNELWLWQLTDEGSTWTQISVSGGPSPRADHISFLGQDGKLYVMGGVDEFGNLLCDLWSYDWIEGVWEQIIVPDIPCLAESVMEIVGQFAFFFGGVNSSGNSLNTSNSLDLSNILQGFIAELVMPEPLQGSGSFVKNGTVNIFGGYLDDFDLLTPGNQVSYSQNVWTFTSVRKGDWSGLSTTGTIKELTDMAYTQDTLENFFYVFGGKSYDYETSTEIFSNEIFKLDLNTNIWSKLSTTLPVALADFTATYVHGSSKSASDTIYLLGGRTSTNSVSESIYAFDVNTNTLTTVSTSIKDLAFSKENLSLFLNFAFDMATINLLGYEQI